MKRIRSLLEKIAKVLFLDWKTERTFKAYLNDFYIYWHDLGGKDDNPKEAPFYVTLENRAKGLCCLMMAIAGICATGCVVTCIQDGRKGLAWLAPLLVACAAIVFLGHPEVYWGYKKQYKEVKVVRFFTKEVMKRFETDYETLKKMVQPYKDKKAAEKAEEEKRQQAEAAEKARKKEEAKDEFLPGFMALLEYVQENFKVLTPNPQKYEGKFTICLPQRDDDKLKEFRFDYNKSEVNRLVVMISNMDHTMQTRANLYMISGSGPSM